MYISSTWGKGKKYAKIIWNRIKNDNKNKNKKTKFMFKLASSFYEPYLYRDTYWSLWDLNY